MKINPQMLTDPALGAALAALQGEGQAAGQATAAPAALRQQVELLNDANIRLLLDAMGKTLGEMGKLGGDLPPAAAREAAGRGQATLGAATVLPKGLASMVRGARSGGEAFAAFAQTLADAAQLNEIFPRGLKPETLEALAVFAARTADGGDFTAAVQTLARQPAATPEGRALLAALFPEGLTPETTAALETFARKLSEGGDFAAKLLVMARQLVDSPDGDGALLTAARSLLAALMPEQPAAVQTELAGTAAAPGGNISEQPEPAVREELAKASAALAKEIPEKVRQAAAFHDFPALEEALVRQKVADSLPWRNMPAETLRQASRTLREMAAAVPASDQAAAETPAGQRVLVMTMPIYFGDGRSYPAYLHISRDRDRQPGGDAATPRETWLRLCVATDNLGAVDMVFYLRGEQQLSIRVAFGDREAGEDFRRALPALRDSLAASPLTLADIAVVAGADKQ